jgi:type II secretory pathway component PulC
MANERGGTQRMLAAAMNGATDTLAAQLRAHVAKHGPALATAVLGLAIVLQLVEFATAARDAFSASEPLHRANAATRARTVDIELLTNAHLFGQASPATSAAPDSAPAPAILVLTGVIASEDPAHGMGILGASPLAAKLYAVGDSLPGGGLLRSVYPDHVLFERDGAVQTLYLQKRSAVAAISAAAVATRQVAEPQAEAIPAPSEPQESPPKMTVSERRAIVARAQQDWQRRNAGD